MDRKRQRGTGKGEKTEGRDIGGVLERKRQREQTE